jgi:predicted  nucleic acid-binding Zn ribbon protein
MRTITIYQLTQALLCTDRNIRDREGSSLPKPIYGRQPREYDLSEVLWVVHWQEREQICRYLRIDPQVLKATMKNAIEPDTSYIPDDGGHDSAMF